MTLSKNVLTVMTGTVIGQLIPVLATPFLSRLYTAEQFGVLALYMSISALFVLIAAGRYEMAIMLPPEKEKATNIVGLSLLITLAMTVFTAILVAGLGPLLAKWLNADSLGVYLLLIPASVLLMGCYQTLYNWTLRERNFKIISTSRIIQSITTVAGSLVFGYTKSFYHGLVIGFVLGQLFGAIYLLLIVQFKLPIEWKAIKFSEIKKVAYEFKEFPQVNSFHALLDTLQNYGLNLLISFGFGNQVLGWFSFSYRILKAPLAIVGSAYSQVLYTESNQMKIAGQSFRPLLVKSMRKILLICSPFFIILLFFAPYIFKIAFGDEWEEAGSLTRLLIPWLIMNFLASPISQVPNIMGKQKRAFTINLIGVVLSLAGFVLSMQLFSTYTIPFLVLSIISALYLGYLIKWILKISDTAGA